MSHTYNLKACFYIEDFLHETMCVIRLLFKYHQQSDFVQFLGHCEFQKCPFSGCLSLLSFFLFSLSVFSILESPCICPSHSVSTADGQAPSPQWVSALVVISKELLFSK